MMPFSQHEPKIALVTGAGRGLGRELALGLAAKGLKVAALGRNAGDLETLAQAAPGIRPVVADVADTGALRAAFERIEAELGPVDTLINNAAVYPHRDFLEESPESFMEVMAINFGGVAVCTMLALAGMVERGHGRIVNVATFADLKPAPLASAYSVSKGAARILTRAIQTDLEGRFPNIVINDWIPGALKTSMGIPDGIDPALAAKWGVALALWHDPALEGVTFVQDREHLPVLSLKRQLFNRVTGRVPKPRVLQV